MTGRGPLRPPLAEVLPVGVVEARAEARAARASGVHAARRSAARRRATWSTAADSQAAAVA